MGPGPEPLCFSLNISNTAIFTSTEARIGEIGIFTVVPLLLTGFCNVQVPVGGQTFSIFFLSLWTLDINPCDQEPGSGHTDIGSNSPDLLVAV